MKNYKQVIYDHLKETEWTYTASELEKEFNIPRKTAENRLLELFYEGHLILDTSDEEWDEVIYRIQLPEGRKFYKPDLSFFDNTKPRSKGQFERALKVNEKFHKYTEESLRVSQETLTKRIVI